MRVVPRVTLTKLEAAEALGVSLDHFERHVRPHLRVIRSGRRVLIRMGELERWAHQHEAFALASDSD
jgi:excisionase family DNA binding protein